MRPAAFCAPSAAGLALALGLTEPRGAAEQAAALREGCALLLAELAERPTPSREEALAVAETLGRANWAWAAAAIGALRSAPLGRPWRGSGLEVWSRLTEWEDQAPPGEAGSKPVDPQDAARAAGGAARPRRARRGAAHPGRIRGRDRLRVRPARQGGRAAG